MQHDRWGLALTTDVPEAARQFDATLDGLLAFHTDTGLALKAALTADPQMALAHCTAGCFLKMFGSRAADERARKSLAKAQEAAKGASERERRHVAALAAWCDDDWPAAIAAWDDILALHPHDVLALKLAHYLIFYRGDSAGMRDSTARVLPRWSKDVPGYGYVLGCHAFGLEESGDFAAAERTGREATAINPADIWATHAVAHVMEMQDRADEGIAWIDRHTGEWTKINFFTGHVWWHMALFRLERGEIDAALALYDAHVWAEPSDQYLDICNAASLLWRIEESGGSVGSRWQALLPKVEPRLADTVLPFADAHYAMALVGAGRIAEAQALAARLKAVATPDARLAHAVSLAAVEALVAVGRGDAAWACKRLLQVRPLFVALGGSHAQRDIFERTLVACALRAGRKDVAGRLVDERLRRRPANLWARRVTAALAA
ncbi:MAG: tetratricopeptide repeat protein [Alphaproteobacteria bacterium]|nr:tetratricopeptide repeat protein [Alphaproteobacteria bacterium]